MSRLTAKQRADAEKAADRLVDSILRTPPTVALELYGIAEHLEAPRISKADRVDMARRLRIYGRYVQGMRRGE